MATMTIDGEVVNIGPKPYALTHLGFRDRDEVERLAVKYSTGKPCMKMDDVAEWFRRNY